LVPDQVYDQVGFDKLLQYLAALCTGKPAMEVVKALQPGTCIQSIITELTATNELKESIEQGVQWHLVDYESIEDISRIAHIEGFVLSEEQILKIRSIMQNIASIIKSGGSDEMEEMPLISGWISRIVDPVNLILAVERVFDQEGDVKPDASPELSKIYKQLESRSGAVADAFRKAAGALRSKGLLADNIESFRNGRRVLAVPSEHKRKIKGIIHDESGSGKTVFIEPQEVISINNDIFELNQERKREIRRILRELSALLLSDFQQLEVWLEDVTRFDLLRAKAQFARQVDGVLPKLEQKACLNIAGARHPLLLLKFSKEGRQVVPNDVTLNAPNRLLVLSGPNAGGKSILLKALGLNQMMVQTGILPSCSVESEFGVFNTFCVDIGDHQSLDDDLSTYSSHLTYMRRFLEKADESTLILIDEFGSGTDPEIGGAIAEAILSTFNERGVWGMVTTHYPNLKLFAYRTKGLVNGALQFNSDNLRPTFKLQIGKPGSSFAFEIATNVGLHRSVINYARKRTGKKYGQIEKLLVDLQSEKTEVEEKLKILKEQEVTLQRLKIQYEGLQRELDIRRKKAKIERKELLLQLKAEENKRLEKLISELKEKEKLEEARAALKISKVKQSDSIDEIRKLHREVIQLEPEGRKGDLKIGDHVRLRKGDSVGEIVEMDNGRARIQMGLITMEAKVDDLVKVAAPIEVNPKRSVATDLGQTFTSVKTSLDIRGMRKSDAEEILIKYLDQALMSGLNRVTILHGRGNGVLRKSVWNIIKDYKALKASHPDEESGGDGVTLVSIG
jgi:DNA mismatch repair protein MutS2